MTRYASTDTKWTSLPYVYKGIERTARIAIVTGSGEPIFYFHFKVRPATFVKKDGEWVYCGDEMKEEVKEAIIAGLEEYLNKNALG